jgi:protein-L-isoaspartate O-methyltransferase
MSQAASQHPKKSSSEPVGSQAQLIEKLVAAGVLNDRAVATLRAVDRQHFVQTYAGVPGTMAYQVRSTLMK